MPGYGIRTLRGAPHLGVVVEHGLDEDGQPWEVTVFGPAGPVRCMAFLRNREEENMTDWEKLRAGFQVDGKTMAEHQADEARRERKFDWEGCGEEDEETEVALDALLAQDADDTEALLAQGGYER